MKLAIRAYENSDGPLCCKLWNSHFEQFPNSLPIKLSTWDNCIASKLYFDRRLLWVASDSQTDKPLGFIHIAHRFDEKVCKPSPRRLILNALCIEPASDEIAVAAALIDAACVYANDQESEEITALGSPDEYAFYLLVPPLHGLLGVHADDHRLQGWLRQANFQANRPTDLWQVDLQSMRLPMDRGQIAVRRTSSVGRVLSEDCQSHFLANVYGHGEQLRFSLQSRTGEAAVSEIVFLTIEQSTFTVGKGTALLLLPAIPTSSQAQDELTFLIAESLRQLQYERYTTATVVAYADQPQVGSLLQRLSFRALASGVVYHRYV